jgi:hypothetical protein
VVVVESAQGQAGSPKSRHKQKELAQADPLSRGSGTQEILRGNYNLQILLRKMRNLAVGEGKLSSATSGRVSHPLKHRKGVVLYTLGKLRMVEVQSWLPAYDLRRNRTLAMLLPPDPPGSHAAPVCSALMASPLSHISLNMKSCGSRILQSRQLLDSGHAPLHRRFRACFFMSSLRKLTAFCRQATSACCRFVEVAAAAACTTLPSLPHRWV